MDLVSGLGLVAWAAGCWAGRLHAWLQHRPRDTQGLPTAEEAKELRQEADGLAVEGEPGSGAIWAEAAARRA
eukprot:3054456-Lingulodinium_polyedra.AAC.1